MNPSWHQRSNPQQHASVYKLEAREVRDDSVAANFPNHETVAKKRKLSIDGEGRRRLSKTTRACDACKPSLTSPRLHVTYDQTQPVRHGHDAQVVDDARHLITSVMTDGQEIRRSSRSRSSPELEATEIGGEYVDTTSGLSFLARARKRLVGFREAATESQKPDLQPLTTAGDKPMVLATELPILPDKYEAHELLDLYFDVCIATYKPLHRPTIDQWYATAQSASNAGKASQVLGHARASVLLCIFAAATFHRQKARGATDDATALTMSDAYFQQSIKLTDNETGVPHLESAQARLIQVLYLMGTSRVNQAWYIFGNLLQILSALGMHRRDRRRSSVNGGSDYIHIQCRKRVFWCAYILDKYLGVVFGRPRHFHDDDIDQDYPDCINDDEMTVSGLAEGIGTDACLTEAFVCNAKLSRIVGKISRELYSIKSMPERNRIEATQRFTHELDNWHSSLPSFISSVRPSILVRSFRRQSIALRLAHYHAVMHLHRPMLLARMSSIGATGVSQQQESITQCITAARDALGIVNAMAAEGTIFHAFWWTHYVTFCALAVVYVWDMQLRQHEISSIDRGKLIELAESCQVHLAQATASNSPSRRYSIILEELRMEATASGKTSQRNGKRAWVPHPSIATSFVPQTSPSQIPLSAGAHTGSSYGYADMLDMPLTGPFRDWQTSDWLDLDASAFGTMSGFSPDMQWFDNAYVISATGNSAP
ncbi:hypothetical protein LTR95_011259 [Oleoguttula sp. CCFEE 5521]